MTYIIEGWTKTGELAFDRSIVIGDHVRVSKMKAGRPVTVFVSGEPGEVEAHSYQDQIAMHAEIVCLRAELVGLKHENDTLQSALARVSEAMTVGAVAMIRGEQPCWVHADDLRDAIDGGTG